ncbi:hypothetical protein FRC03_004259 [Tulasnella sp. 419]|nr:hypothetical protein FRC03_004259 [Tulasnella sp. 419]
MESVDVTELSPIIEQFVSSINMVVGADLLEDESELRMESDSSGSTGVPAFNRSGNLL